MRKIFSLFVLIISVVSFSVFAQETQADFQKLKDDFKKQEVKSSYQISPNFKPGSTLIPTKETILHYDGDNDNALGLTEGGVMLSAVYLTPDMIAPHVGEAITQLMVYVNDLPSGTFELVLWEAGATPGTVIYTQDVTSSLVELSWNTFDLDVPYELTADGVFVGVSVNHSAGEFPVGVDAGPANANGDFASFDDGITWENIGDFGFGNWNIRTVVEILADPNAPAAATDLSVAVAAMGDMEATVSWTNPTQTSSGEELTELTSIELYSNETLVQTIADPVIGGAESEVVDLTGQDPGSYTFKVVGINTAGNGVSASETVWVGNDVPVAPTNIVLESVDGNGSLTWDEPIDGLNGGYMPGVDSYRIERSDGVIVEENFTGSQPYVDNTISGPANYSYTITSINSVGEGGSATSNVELLGVTGETVTVGDGVTTDGTRIPLDFFWQNSLSQVIYYPEELGFIGQIESIAYFNNFVDDFSAGKPVKIWIGETDVTDLSGGYIPASELTLVYDGELSIPAGENLVVVPFNEPFFYEGGNLVVMANRPMDTEYFSSSDRWIQTQIPEGEVKALNNNSDGTEFDPFSPPEATVVSSFANTVFFYNESPTVIPNERDFIVDDGSDVFTTVYWLGATSLGISDDVGDLTLDTDYTITDNGDGTALLTIDGAYLSSKITDVTDPDLVLTITFDTEDVVDLTIHPAAKSVVGVHNPEPFTVLMGTTFAELMLPATIDVDLNDGTISTLNVTWNEADYNQDQAGDYVITGALDLGTLENPENLQAEVEVTVEYVAFGLMEDFNAIETWSLPEYWDGNFSVRADGGIDDSPRLTKNLWNYALTGDWQTPIVSMGSDPLFSLMFRAVDYSGYPGTATPAENFTFTIWISTDFGETFTELHTVDAGNHTPSTEYEELTVDMTAYADEHAIIRVEAEVFNEADIYLDFDNVIIGTFYTATFNVTDVNTTEPMQGATINLYPVGQTEVTETLTTDELGEASIILGDGTNFDYEIIAHGYYDASGTFAISSADELISVSMTPLPTHQVSGSVVTNDDTPVNLEGATVTLEGYDTYEALTDVNGDFLIEDVYEETYTITISYPGYESYVDEAMLVDADVAMGEITLVEIIEDPYALAVDVDHVAQEALFSWNNSETIMLFQHDGTIPAEPNAFFQDNTKVYGTIFDLTAYPDAILSHIDFHHMQWDLPNDNYPFLVHIVDWDTYTVIETVGPINTNVNDDWETDVMLGDIDFSAYSQVGILIQPQGGDPTDAYPCLTTDATGPGGLSITADFSDLGGYTVNSADVGDFFINLWIETAYAEEEVIKLDNVTANSIGVDNSRKGKFTSTANINPVQNAKVNNFNSKAFLGYNVYLDGADTPSNAEPILSGTEYLFEGLDVGMHTASVEATYSTGTSTLVSIDFEVLSTHQVTYSVVGENGTISATVNEEPITSGDIVVNGEDIVFTATPDANYQVKEWIVNGDVVTDFIDADFTYASIEEDVNVTVEFEHITHEVLFDVVGENGTIEATVNEVAITTGDMVMQGVDVLFTAIPDDGYIVKSWTVNSTVQGGLTDLEYLHENVQEPLTVAVEFEVDITNVPSEALSNLYAYPNPFTNQITISNTENVQRVVITNLVGQQVMDVRLNGETEINTDDLSEGVYLVTFVANNGEKLVKKMIKQ